METDKKKVLIDGKLVSYQPKVQPQNPTGELSEGDDLAPIVKVTLGTYLHRKSSDVNQVYGAIVNEGALTEILEDSAPPSFSNPETPGKTPDIVVGGMSTAVETFFESLEGIPAMADAVADFKADGYHNVGDSKTLADFIDKTKRSKENNKILSNFDSAGGGYGGYKIDGGTGLHGQQSHPASGPEGGVQEAISAALLQNRFNPTPGASPFIRDGKTSRNDTKSGDLISHPQTALGVYVPGDDNSAIGIKQLQQLGLALMIRATGHSTKGAETFRMSEDDAFLGSFEQFMLDRVKQEKLSAKEVMKSLGVYGEPDLASLPGTPNTDITDSEMIDGGLYNYSHGDNISRLSYGHLNSPIEPFGGPLPTGMLFISVVSVGGLILSVGLLMSAFRAIDPFQNPDSEASPNNFGQLGRYAKTWKFQKGTYTPKEGKNDVANLFMELFGIPQTRVPFDVCFTNGLNAFYGFAEGSITDAIQGTYDIDLQFVIERAIDLIKTPGYYAVIMRSVIRDVEQIIDSVEKAISAIARPGGLGAVTEIFGIIEAIVTSTTWRFIMTMVGIGDAIACDKFKVFHPLSIDIDDVVFDTPFIQYKSRISDEVNGLAWGNQTAQSMFLMPRSIFALNNATMKLGPATDSDKALLANIIGDVVPTSTTKEASDGGGALKNMSKRGMMKSVAVSADISNRLPGDLVHIIEQQIDSTYMPFYFHDLRTNEIINFHAFLESLTENFAPEYNQVDGYGRVDSVQIYKKTSRTINVSFITVATNDHKDLDHMWYKINKLVSLVYPQFDKGKTMISPTGRRFRQPLSQQVAASPVIRLRIGDMIRSNYSRVGMARLFGFDEAEVQSSFSKNVKAEIRNKLVQKYREGVDAEIEAFRVRTSGQQETVGGKLRYKDFAKEDVPIQVGDYVRLDYAAGGQIKMKDNAKGPKNAPKDRSYVGPVKAIHFQDKSTSKQPGLFRQEDVRIEISLNTAELKKEEDMDNRFIYKKKEADTITFPLSSCDGANKYQYQYVVRPKVLAALKEEVPHPEEDADQVGNMVKFLSPNTNPIIRSFENSGGQGLAGVITSLDFDYNLAEATWTTDIGRRTTKSLKISFAFTVIHDITPGLDHAGGLRALSHPLGPFENTFGSPSLTTDYGGNAIIKGKTILGGRRENNLYNKKEDMDEQRKEKEKLDKKRPV